MIKVIPILSNFQNPPQQKLMSFPMPTKFRNTLLPTLMQRCHPEMSIKHFLWSILILLTTLQMLMIQYSSSAGKKSGFLKESIPPKSTKILLNSLMTTMNFSTTNILHLITTVKQILSILQLQTIMYLFFPLSKNLHHSP